MKIIKCQGCNGSGGAQDPDTGERVDCPVCNGTGKEEVGDDE